MQKETYKYGKAFLVWLGLDAVIIVSILTGCCIPIIGWFIIFPLVIFGSPILIPMLIIMPLVMPLFEKKYRFAEKLNEADRRNKNKRKNANIIKDAELKRAEQYLKDSGALSDEEYSKEKAKLLG